MVTNNSEKTAGVLKTTAHDLNNIFTSILNSVELLKIKNPNEAQLPLIQNIENNSLLASEIINQLLLNDTEKKELKKQLNITTLISDLELTLKKSFGSKINVNVHLEKELNDIYGNYSEIFRVLLNFCVNAKESFNKNGTISISAFNVHLTEDKIPSNLNSQNYVLIEVSDNGKGIAEKDINKIFETGFSTKSSKKTSGIGLSIVKQIIEEHKGFIEVKSKIGDGTTFKVYIPKIKKAKIIIKTAAQKSILIAEDSKEIAEELSELLNLENYISTVAFSGESVLDILKSKKLFDLFIIDKKLPGISGLEVIEKIRELDLLVPIILASGSIPSDEEKILRELKINKYLKKPYLFEDLLQIIQELT